MLDSLIIRDLINYKISISILLRKVSIKILMYGDPTRFDTVNTHPIKVLSLDLTNNQTLNIGCISSNNVHIDQKTNSYYFDNFKKDSFVDLFYKKNGFIDFSDKKLLTELPLHFIDKTNQKIINGKSSFLSFYENQHSMNMQEKIIWGGNLFLNWNHPSFVFITDPDDIDLNICNKFINIKKNLSICEFYADKKFIFDTIGRTIFDHWNEFYNSNRAILDDDKSKNLIIPYLDAAVIEDSSMSAFVNILDTFDKG